MRTLCLLLLFCFSLLKANSQPGSLDPSFGNNGILTTSFLDNSNLSYEEGRAVLTSTTGDVFVVITVNGYTRIAKYLPDGKPDSSYGNAGFSNAVDIYAPSAVLQGDKIIVAGNALARYTADGFLDSSFGEGGKVITELGGPASIRDIALYENRLYAVGSLKQNFDPINTYGVVAAYQLEAPEPAISIDDVTVSESRKFAIATVRLSAPAEKLVRLRFTTRNKTAVRTQDYIGLSAPLVFIPGVNTTAKIFIPIIDDNESESNEQFEILLSNAHNASIPNSIGVVTIIDDDESLITKQNTSLHVNVSPNPSKDAFTIQLQRSNNLKQPVSIRVYDGSGRLIEQRNNITIGQSIHLGNQYKAGTYIIEAVQGSQQLQTKVIKMGK